MPRRPYNAGGAGGSDLKVLMDAIPYVRGVSARERRTVASHVLNHALDADDAVLLMSALFGFEGVA